MACELFKKAPRGTTLEKLNQALQAMADALNEERKAGQVSGFARVFVTGVMRDPRDGSLSFMIQFSDHDEVAPARINAILKRKRKNGRQHGDPYLA